MVKNEALIDSFYFGWSETDILSDIHGQKSYCTRMKEWYRAQCSLFQAHPHILYLALFIWAAFLGAGVAICVVFERAHQDEMRDEARALAMETGAFFSDNLDQAILPLFSLAQFVNELDIFKNLATQVGLIGEPNALPLIPKAGNETPTHRNVTGVCDDPQLVERYTKIAADIKQNAKMDGILVNLQLVPDAVVCLLHPLNNTEDFPEGVFMDNSGALGHDLLNDPQRKFIAEATVPSDKVVIAGPVKLRQCQDCDPLVEQAFIARLPIVSDTNVITVNGQGYNKWGFAVALINWKELVARSGVYQTFESTDLEFQLTRTDRKYQSDTDTFTENVVILAQSDGFSSDEKHKVSTILDTTNNEWEMTVAYCSDGTVCTAWFPWSIVCVVILSTSLSVLVYVIFSQAQLHSDALAEKSREMAEHARQAARNERELNDFIAHEVRNPVAAALSACSFVTAAVSESQPLMDVEAQKSVREDVRIIDSSLSFINDLLRSMLDLHRARSRQMTLEVAPTDLKHDILESVASMLYTRDENFDVLVECPDNLLAIVDQLRLRQVVLNLARNSAKFVEKGFVRLRCSLWESGVIINVEDSGPGIPEEKRGSLFRKFQTSLDELSQGTGIGLSLVQKLVDLMDGTIELDNSFDSGVEGCPGAKFDIKIKCKILKMDEDEVEGDTPAEDKTEETSTSGNSSGCEMSSDLPASLNVLFVDDDVILRKLFSRSLKRVRPEWTISEAASGETAIKMAEEGQEFDLIFLDQYMTSVEKNLLGTETVRGLRSCGVQSLICGLSANDLEDAFLTAGADAFMLKPFPTKPDALLEELKRVYNKKPFHCTDAIQDV